MAALGAYGIGVAGLDAVQGPPAPAEWPVWTLSHRVIPAVDDAAGLSVWPSRARIGLPGVGEMHLDADARAIDFATSEPWSADALLHPGLAPAATVIASWMGRSSFHASAVAHAGRVWALLGDRRDGKSTTAAHLVDLGCALVTDDLLVVEGEAAFTGPPTIDLRADAGPRLGGTHVGRLGSRERWRRQAVVAEGPLPLAGWVSLHWHDGPPSVREVEPGERLQTLNRHLSMSAAGQATHLLDLTQLPGLALTRPHRLDAAPAAAAMIQAAFEERGIRAVT